MVAQGRVALSFLRFRYVLRLSGLPVFGVGGIAATLARALHPVRMIRYRDFEAGRRSRYRLAHFGLVMVLEERVASGCGRNGGQYGSRENGKIVEFIEVS